MNERENVTPWYDLQENEEAFIARIEYMTKINRIWKWESSSKALYYLLIKGKLTAVELQELLDLRGKSIYRSLKPLMKAGLIAKEENPEDKRESFYFATQQNISDPRFSSEFLNYLAKSEQLEILSEYLANANKGSIAMIKVMTELMQDVLLGGSEQAEEMLNASIFLETVFEVSDYQEISQKLKDFIKRELRPSIKRLNKSKEPKKYPVGLYIAYVPIPLN